MNKMDDAHGKETSATQSVYFRLREMILTGALPAGEKLKIEQLRVLMKTGASPVREALSLLTSDMLVERIDQRGFRAAAASKANFEEILNLRCTLEDMALRGALSRADTTWEENLVLSHHRMQRIKPHGSHAFEAAHKAFHMALLQNSGSPMLERFCSQLYDLNIRYRYLASGSATYRTRDIAAEHNDILDAAVSLEADRASACLIRHYRLTGDYLAKQFDH